MICRVETSFKVIRVLTNTSICLKHYLRPSIFDSLSTFNLEASNEGKEGGGQTRCEDPGTVDTKQQRQNSASNFIDVPQIDQLEREMSTSITCKNRIST